jgi:hypothetical protein
MTFLLRLRPDRSCSDPIKSLRWVLKKAQRVGLKVIDAIEEKDEKPKSTSVSENSTNRTQGGSINE